ncbi:bifunctional D-glycero-beta-D-manno-heptose-7-phosphate kinase/D-glycero-beta-D-manno-heptose 1-phosphate adenylyltransferase HldE [Candidatus Williamhamiltonella defendens]|uniref:bifunctional D-glycero-beta-D-manno-heptose-7-phosphate kinase/D-glycero-beta-D-manno-heptose 1-phosphate adenylyltransferase HldE n=1 Tax=Candidatus Williamhamiltonella defendens TaxID=138072 RepID=UPI00130DBE61|nr:bifunctional D-glycero-beta-D-manno-heptose-7-phosphate kinase/D-glycero-beta-D-manno-heptose 1-phosphate adenylyltransferase HldE [Candidatus Hamiltonella defensa]
MKLTLSDIQQAKILVVGDVMLDRYWYGPVDRISPEAPVSIVKVDQIRETPGGAANVAMNIAALGAKVHLIGLIGKDEAGKILTQKLSEAQVDCDFVSSSTYSTLIKLRVLSRHQQLIRLDFEKNAHTSDAQKIKVRIDSLFPHMTVVVFSDYAKGTLNKIQEMIQLAKKAEIPLLIDPKGNNFKRYSGATVLTPNLSEFEAIVGHCKKEQDLVDKGSQLIKHLDLSALLITRSENGITLLQKAKPPLHLSAQAHEVFDVTGAGDTVIAVLATALASGHSLEESSFFANAAAGVVVGKLGTSTVSFSELQNVSDGSKKADLGIVNEQQLKSAVQKSRSRGEKLVMTNGCFDILHAGHIAYLSEAKKYGDRLIVAVNTDDSVRKLKGQMRPINPLAQRMAVLSALKYVDWVVPFADNTPERLISEILPDVLIKGGDYQPHQIAGSKAVVAAGGQIKISSHQNGLSSSKIIKKIKNNSL